MWSIGDVTKKRLKVETWEKALWVLEKGVGGTEVKTRVGDSCGGFKEEKIGRRLKSESERGGGVESKVSEWKTFQNNTICLVFMVDDMV